MREPLYKPFCHLRTSEQSAVLSLLSPSIGPSTVATNLTLHVVLNSAPPLQIPPQRPGFHCPLSLPQTNAPAQHFSLLSSRLPPSRESKGPFSSTRPIALQCFRSQEQLFGIILQCSPFPPLYRSMPTSLNSNRSLLCTLI